MDPGSIKDHCIYTRNDPIDGLIPCEKISNKLNNFCDEHQEFLLSEYQIENLEKKYLCADIISKIDTCNNSTDKETKTRIVKDLYEKLCLHKYFIYKYTNLQTVVFNKLIEFYFMNDIKHIFDPQIYLQKLFPLNNYSIIMIFIKYIYIRGNPDNRSV